MCLLFSTAYTTTTLPGGFNYSNFVIGLASGLAFGLALFVLDLLVRRCNLRTFNVAILGLFFGYLMGQTALLIFNAMQDISPLPLAPETTNLLKIAVFLFCTYIGMITTVRATEELQFSIPFVKFKATIPKKKDILVDWTILMDSRIIDLASSGLLDDHIIMPRFILKELYLMLESGDEVTKNKARRCLDIFKKLEAITSLDLRYADNDFPDIKDSTSKLMQLARQLDANIITADVSRLQQCATEGVRIINIHMLSNALKPMTGEQLSIKIQRYGKEPRQGVGYLDDGTMVVVNGGAEFIGDTIKAHVLSVKHTSSGRMIFCNATDDMMGGIEATISQATVDMESMHKNYFAL